MHEFVLFFHSFEHLLLVYLLFISLLLAQLLEVRDVQVDGQKQLFCDAAVLTPVASALAHLFQGLQVPQYLLEHLGRTVYGSVHFGDKGPCVGAIQIILGDFLQLVYLDAIVVVVVTVCLHHRLRLRLRLLCLRNGVDVVQNGQIHARMAEARTTCLFFAPREP